MAVNTELLLKQWLEADETIANGWPVSFDVPAESSATNPIRCITIERDGGEEDVISSRPLLTIQVWGETRWIVSEAAHQLVLPRVKRLCEHPDVADWDITGMSHFPMTDGRPRYQITVQLTIRDYD